MDSYSNMVGLEMSLQHHHNIPQHNPHHMQQQHQQIPTHPTFPIGNKSKSQSLTFSDDDETGPGISADTNNSTDDGKRKSTCPWQRMKWTDNMVRLLIMVVYYIGDEVGSEGVVNDVNGKKKSAGGIGVLQKKGKWKSVSRALMERGFYVSPQQCEDKFNDLNKRYKRVNDILGKGTACRVVENQSLLETMDHLSQKMKEEVKKLLNSKHLFFREMCAYHSSCGHGGTTNNAGGATSVNIQPALEVVAVVDANSHQVEQENIRKGPILEYDEDGEEEDDGEDDNDDDDDDDHSHGQEEEEDDDDLDGSRKRQRKMGSLVQEFSKDMANVIQDCGKSSIEKRQWLKSRMMQLEEEHVKYLCQAFELQKQRLKWEKFTSKKEREMEREKLSNERKKLENERMALLLRQKELELLDFHQNHRNSDPSSITG